ncbi:MAG: catalase-related domain-containing protein [Anaerovoracaceae bacterium]
MEKDILFKQAEESFKAMTAEEKQALVYNIAESIMFVNEGIQEILLENIKHVSTELSERVKQRI